MKSETWSLKRALVIGVLCAGLADLTACLLPTAVPPVSTPSCTATSPPTSTSTPTVVPTLTPGATFTLPPTSMPSATPASTPTGTPVASPGVALVRGPYLQSVTTDTITVIWETDLPSYGGVAYGETEAYGSRAADPVEGVRHAVTLTGLVPYTLYHYRVESRGAPLSEDAAFRTAAGPDQPGFTFVVFGDTRTQHRVHRAVVERIVALEPDFAIHTGDLVAYGYSAYEWEIFFEIERDLMARVPLFPTLGNHEAGTPYYFDLFYLPGNERWYAFDYGNARFVCLEVDGVADFDAGSEQYAWLEETLATNKQPWLFAAFHVPPYSSLREDAPEIAARTALTPLFERYGVDIVFNGHHHSYQRSVVHGVTYVVTAGGGAPLYQIWQTDEHLLAYRNTYHVTRVTVAGDTLTGVGVTPEGEEFDRFTLTSGGDVEDVEGRAQD